MNIRNIDSYPKYTGRYNSPSLAPKLLQYYYLIGSGIVKYIIIHASAKLIVCRTVL